MRRNSILDLWKFFMSLVIVVYHYNYFYLSWNDYQFRGGYICVDAFFVLSGYFYAKTICNKNPTLKDFIKRRIRTLYPYYFFTLLVSVFVMWNLGKTQSVELKYLILAIIEEVLVVHEWSISLPFYFNGVSWYVSAMLGVSFIYYGMQKLLPKDKINQVVVAFTVASMLVMLCKWNHVHIHGMIHHIIPLGVLRGLSGMGIGWLTYQYRNKLQHLLGRQIAFVIFSICFSFIVVYTKNGISDFLIYPISVGIIISSQNLFLLNDFMNECSAYLGKMSYMIYLCHIFIYNIMQNYLVDFSCVFFLTVSVLFSIISMKLCDLCKEVCDV